MTGSHHRTPVQIIKRHLNDWIDHSTMTETIYATLVREYHEAHYAPGATTVEWSHHPDPAARMEADRRHVMRWFDKGVHARLPAEMYDTMVMVFPPERRFALEQALAAERGGLFLARPDTQEGGGVEELGRMAKEASEAIAAVGRLYEDGRLDRKDAKEAPGAISEIDQAVAKLLEMRADIERNALGREPERDSNGAMVVKLYEAKNGNGG